MDLNDAGTLPSTVGGVGSNASLDLNKSQGDSIDQNPAAMKRRDAMLSKHPDFQVNEEKWLKYQDTYDACNLYQYIFKHGRESPESYANRIKRGYYYNYVASVVDLMVSYIFHSPIERKYGALEKFINEVATDVNLEGDNYQAFMEEVAAKMEVFGHVLVLVDVPRGDSPTTEEERKQRKIRPYTKIITPLQLWDWSVDEYNNFNWIKIKICVPEDRTWEDPIGENDYFLIYSRNEWTLYKVDDEDATIVETGINPLGEVPVAVVRSKKEFQHAWFGLSSVRDIADINIGILNWTSLGDEEIYERCLNILTMERDEGANIELSHHNVLEYASGTERPEYLVPGETPLDLIEKWIMGAINQIYRLAKMGGTTGLVGVREATSGIAYAYEFNETNQALANKAAGLERAENEIHRLIAKYYGIKWDGDVAYSREFGVEDFIQELNLLAVARKEMTSETAIKTLEKKMVAKMFTREKKDLVQKVLDEIETADPRMIDVLEMFNPPEAPGGGNGSSGSKSSSSGE